MPEKNAKPWWESKRVRRYGERWSAEAQRMWRVIFPSFFCSVIRCLYARFAGSVPAFFHFLSLGVIATAVLFQLPSLGMIAVPVFFQLPFLGVIENAVFFKFPSRVWLKMLCFSSSLSRVWLKMSCFSSSHSRAWLKMLCFSSSFSSACTKSCVFPVPFPSSLPVPFPVPFADSLCFSEESALKNPWFPVSAETSHVQAQSRTHRTGSKAGCPISYIPVGSKWGTCRFYRVSVSWYPKSSKSSRSLVVGKTNGLR